jgi:hypothetical protein
MAGLGRLLQIAGWLWLVGGFVLPALGLADITVFPGLILIFLARALRTQAARNAPPEPDEVEQAPEPERILNTDRPRVEPKPPPKPSPQPVTIPQQSELSPQPTRPTSRESVIERIAAAGREVEADLTKPGPTKPDVTKPGLTKSDRDEPDVTAPRGETKPMSSEEMIAAAHRRWNADKRPGRS